jgi:hypothetical protein
MSESDEAQILQWLSSVDHILNQGAARLKHEPGTGEWFLKSDAFETWKDGKNQLIWIHGIPGCGKTILSSTVIEHLQDHQSTHPDDAVAYFYFDFNDPRKQNVEECMRSVLAQLCCQCAEFPKELQDFFEQHSRYQKRNLTLQRLRSILLTVIGYFDKVAIVLDALDECQQRPALMEEIELLVKDKSINLNMLVTSRKERDIEMVLETLLTYQISLQGEVVDDDIGLHVRHCLAQDPRLSRRPDAVKQEIEAALIEGAQGMSVLIHIPHVNI